MKRYDTAAQNCKNIRLSVETGVKHAHHCVRAIYNCKMRLHWCLVEYEQWSTGVRVDWLAHTPVCKIVSCWTTQELRIRIKYASKLLFLLCIEVQQTFSFPFSLLRHYQMPECFYFNNSCLWTRATVLSCYCTEIDNVANAVSTWATAAQPQCEFERWVFVQKEQRNNKCWM